MDSRFLPVFRTGPLPARNDITGQRCMVGKRILSTNYSTFTILRKRESIFMEGTNYMIEQARGGCTF